MSGVDPRFLEQHLVLVYSLDLTTFLEPLVAVVATEEAARDLKTYATGHLPDQRLREGVIPVHAQQALQPGDDIILVSSGGETDDPDFDVSENAPDPVGLAAFTDRRNAEAFVASARSMCVPRVRCRTLHVGWLAPLLSGYAAGARRRQ